MQEHDRVTGAYLDLSHALSQDVHTLLGIGLLCSPKKFTTLVSSQAISPAWHFPPITDAEAPHYKKGLTTFSECSSRSISR
jgi:hypothetical protein